MQRELDELQQWYEAQCNGDWEHTYGIEIGTLDNPGWHVEIDLADTGLEDRSFTPVKDVAPQRTWIDCSIANRKFRGAGGAPMLGPILRTFLDWAHQPLPPEFSPPAS